MLSRHTVLRAILMAFLAIIGIWSAAGAQLAADRLSAFPTPIQQGTGRVRLAGLGGFETAVADENTEINLLDYSGNPAGFSDDRDSWSIDLRFSHAEFEEGTTSRVRNDVKVNDGTFILGYHVPKRYGFGGALDYTEAKTLDAFSNSNALDVVGLELIANVYLLEKLSLGVRGGYAGETQDLSTNEFYAIEHEGDRPHIGGGAAFAPVTGITLGLRADAFPTSIEGSSASSTHQDSFSWDRPGSDWSAHLFVNRGRLALGADYDQLSVEGKESVQLSWSERFPWNPSPDDYFTETDTFSEDRSTKTFRTRAGLHVTPALHLSAAWGTTDGDFKVITNPNTLGSLPEGTAETSSSELLGGGSYTFLEDRLMLAGEVKVRSNDLDRSTSTTRLEVAEDNLTFRVGGEFLVGEKLAARAGLVRGHKELTTRFTDEDGIVSELADQTGTFNSWRLATGLGIIPWGAIWQLDLAYDVTLSADDGEDLTHFAAYIRYLF